MDFLDANSILSDFQHGFRHGRSCESQLITTLRDFSNCLNQSSQVDAILLDFSKAFDKVDHQILLSKMEDIGITGPLLSWTSSFLLNRTQHVLLNGSFSDPAKVLSGVPQGTVMGPLLFLIYINDIHRNLSPGTEIRLFADDSLLYRNISDTSDSQTLQKDLDTLQKWELENKMEFHPDKCQVLTVTNKKNRTGFTYNIHGIPLKPHDTAKYLGVTIDKSLNWDAHLKDIYRKASFMLSFLERNLQKVPQHVKIQSYNALVRPLLEYGCCAWDPHTAAQVDKLELIHKRAARFVTGNRARIHGATQANMASLGWTSLQERRAKIRLTNFFKIKEGLLHTPTDDLVPASSSRKGPNFSVPYSRVDAHKFSFFPNTIRQWNSLPSSVKSANSLDLFKSGLSSQSVTPSAFY